MQYTTAQRKSGYFALELKSKHKGQASDLDAPFFFIDLPGSYTKRKKQIKLEGWIKTTGNTPRATLWVYQSNGINQASSPFAVAVADSVQSSKGWQQVTATLNPIPHFVSD